MSTRALTIGQVEKNFSVWRGNQTGKRIIPNKLWDQVKVLINSYGASPVLKRLGISWKQAKKNGVIPTKSVDIGFKKSKALSPFVRIPQDLPNTDERPPKLTFQRGNTQLSLSDPSNEQIRLFIDLLRW